MIIANNLNLFFGEQAIFDDVSFTVDQRQRIGLGGRNGAGKSTLLKAITDKSILDSGSISIIKDKKIAYMPQDVVLQSDRTILEETFMAFAAIVKLQGKAQELENLLAVSAASADLVEQYDDIQLQLATTNPDQARAETKKMLTGLGFSLKQFDQPVASLSVGWKMRIVLAKLLLQKADLYLFDEPTNHLDIVAKEWFLQFLKRANFGFMLVCHERYFLDELCTHILELERGKGTMYRGSFSSYEIQKRHALELLEAAYEEQQKEIKRKTATIERFRASASRAKQAQSMSKALDKIERIAIPPAPKDVSFSFPPVPIAGKTVLKVNYVGCVFGDKTIFKKVSFEVERDNKVAIVAANGVGKTTLFNLIVGNLPIQEGTITFGHNVQAAIFDQDQNRALNPAASIIDNVRDRCPHGVMKDIRAFLGAFLFTHDDVHKQVKVLSGGEKNRVGMISTLLQNANLLLLDEPTNHLDINSKDILLKALQDFRGTLLFVSHDRDFINNLATHIIELSVDGARWYHGNYDSYIYQKSIFADPGSDASTPKVVQIVSASAEPIAKTVRAGDKRKVYELQKKNASIEKTYEKLEQQIQSTQLSCASLAYGSAEYIHTQEQLKHLQQKLQSVEKQWEDIMRELDTVRGE